MPDTVTVTVPVQNPATVIKTPEQAALEKNKILMIENAVLKIEALKRDGKINAVQEVELKRMIDAGQDVEIVLKTMNMNIPILIPAEKTKTQTLVDPSKPPASVSPVGDAFEKINARRSKS